MSVLPLNILIVAVVFVGAAAGAITRYGLTRVPSLRVGSGDGTTSIPWATFLANVSASFMLGVIVRVWGSGNDPLSVSLTAFFAIGFCGALSTMSTYAIEIFVMVRQRATVIAGGYLTLSLGAAMFALWLGLVVGG